MKLSIERMDYQNQINGYYKSLPILDNFNDIIDINEIYKIRFQFATQDEQIQFQGKFPKSYNAKLTKCSCYNYETSTSYLTYDVSFTFNTFWSNESTGELNESAINKRIKVIKKIKEIFLVK